MIITLCPCCAYPQYCGCNESCRERIPEGIKPYISKGNFASCANCGYTASYDFWLDWSWGLHKDDGDTINDNGPNR